MALQPSQKAILSPAHQLSDVAEEFNPAPVTDDMRLVPLDTDVLNTRTEDEYQVAMNLARTAGTTYGRVVGRGLKWRGPNLYGNAYTKLQAKLAKERELKETLAEGVEVQKLYDVREVPGQAGNDHPYSTPMGAARGSAYRVCRRSCRRDGSQRWLCEVADVWRRSLRSGDWTGTPEPARDRRRLDIWYPCQEQRRRRRGARHGNKGV